MSRRKTAWDVSVLENDDKQVQEISFTLILPELVSRERAKELLKDGMRRYLDGH